MVIYIYTAKRTTVNAIINMGPCLVAGISMSGDGAAADCDIYDGTNTQGEKKFHLETASGRTTNGNNNGIAIFKHGIYVVVNASTTNVTVKYKPLTTTQFRDIVETD